jgi:hypothetical protein
MAEKVLVLGESGSGKSTATRSLDPKTTFYINVVGKNLPFKGWKAKYLDFDGKKGNMFCSHNYEEIIKCMEYVSKNMVEIKTIVIDDVQYVMTYEFMERAKEKGYEKFTELASHMFYVLKAPDLLRKDLKVFYLAHTEDVSSTTGMKTKMKTVGKMLDEKLTPEGLFTVVLKTCVNRVDDDKVEYAFITKTNGQDPVKTPDGMFDSTYIPNDLKYVSDKIDEYNNG